MPVLCNETIIHCTVDNESGSMIEQRVAARWPLQGGLNQRHKATVARACGVTSYNQSACVVGVVAVGGH